MKSLLQAWRGLDEYSNIAICLHNRQKALVNGLPLLPQAMLTAALFEDMDQAAILLTAGEGESQDLYESLRPFLGQQVLLFPVLELLPFEVYAHNIELMAARVAVLSRLAAGEKLLVVASVNAVTRRLAPPQAFLAQHLRLRPGDRLEPADLAARLADMGYEAASLTEIPGAFSRRGSIVDIFPLTAQQPLRIEFFDDEIESLRPFDPASQISSGSLDEALILPGRELPLDDAARQRAAAALEAELAQVEKGLHGPDKKALRDTFGRFPELLRQGIWDNGMEALLGLFYEQTCSIFDYLGPAGWVALSEPQEVADASAQLKDERESRYFDLLSGGRLLPSFYYNFLEYEHFLADYAPRPVLMLCNMSNRSGGVEPNYDVLALARELPVYSQQPAQFVQDIRALLAEGCRVVFTASSPVRCQRMAEILQEQELPPCQVLQAGFPAGFASPWLQLAVITERELFSRQSRRRQRRKFKGGSKIDDFLDLQVGDYVVHAVQGIGRYLGVVRLTIGDTERDYLSLAYAGEDKLYVPVDQLDLVQKYIGGEGSAPKLYRLGGGDWSKAKAKVRAAVQDMTEELLRLYSQRQLQSGFAFAPDTEWQREFEDAFPYEETPDQLSSLAEIKEDMESGRVMDRLLCGDVGYGKTEVAMRAAFKAIMDGKQVAILAPTTVLALQHYRTVCQRFEGFPIHGICLSRFNSPAQTRAALAQLAAGQVEIAVGTHRLLSKDVQFKDLGLLIVDEEQRFGVTHKEKIKQLKQTVDVLTLSATPIPRTLHMSLVGMREMSVITTPPEDRHPVQTYVVEYNERLVRDAISRELGRGGQVYYLHNRVQDIYEVAEQLQRELPQARIVVGHGQLHEKELEQVMLDFVEGRADVLLCTTIIENGLDIPNANTLIVDEADTFGLAQLYQIRGRVGRCQRQAFAYFTYRRERVIGDMAKKRLIAIRDFTELGAGFKIAMRDLELRGAGNILGPEQHGHIAAVGFDLYCRLLAEEMDKARGQEVTPLDQSVQLDLQVNAFIPDSYLEDAGLKLEMYKRIAAAADEDDVDILESELTDRYGAPPEVVANLLSLGKLKIAAKRLQISAIVQKEGWVELRFADTHPVTGPALAILLSHWTERLRFSQRKGYQLRIDTHDKTSESGVMALTCRIMNELYDAVSAGSEN